MKRTFFSSLLIASQLHVVACGSYAADDDYIAHEWGTFTSVQGADGIQLEWNPFVTTDLPKFVYDRTRSPDPNIRLVGALTAKSAMPMLQRMETPVIYFYSEKERAVDVSVKFPLGLITEWYPEVTASGPRAVNGLLDPLVNRQSFLRWDDVQVLPRRRHATLETLLPSDKSVSHYYSARETDSDYLRMAVVGGESKRDEHEKFLFYRGVGSFKAPLEFALPGSSEDEVTLRNTGSETLTHLFVLSVRHGSGQFLYIDRLPPGERKTVKHEAKKQIPLSDVSTRLGLEMQEALVKEGLYAAEAAAMVKTWRDSWFEEQGLRVLYALPRAWTDRILPLTLEPRPREVARVMVGRAEMITPRMEWELTKQIVHFSEGDEAKRQVAIDNVRQLGLGRFAQPAARRLTEKLPAPQFTEAAWEVVRKASAQSAAANNFAQR